MSIDFTLHKPRAAAKFFALRNYIPLYQCIVDKTSATSLLGVGVRKNLAAPLDDGAFDSLKLS